MTAKLSATDKNLVLVLLGGEVSHHRSVSSLAENKFVECGDRLTAKGRAAAYIVLATHLPSPTPRLHAELLKASAYASKGQIAPDDPPVQSWQDAPSGDGWYWVEKKNDDPYKAALEKPVYISDGLIRAAHHGTFYLGNRRVCKIPSRPQ